METKLPKIEYNSAPSSTLKDVLLFSVCFGVFFFGMSFASGLYSFSSNDSTASVVDGTSVLAQKEVSSKNPKIVKFEKVNAENILSSADIQTPTPSSTPGASSGEKTTFVRLREVKTASASSVLSQNTTAKKAFPTSAPIARRKYTAGDTLPTRVVISKIGVDTPILNPEWNDIPTLTEALKKGAVRYPQSGLLGENANVLLFGHSAHLKVIYNPAHKAFNDLGDLARGDEIEVYSNQKIYVYRVQTVDLVKNTEEKVDLVSSTPKLTLVTCNNFGAKEDRFVVVAELVSIDSVS